jgi:Zn-dependent M28 family amino/carboxypeptidase
LVAILAVQSAQADSIAESESRLKAAAAYLASDELEGRGVGLKGLDLAAEYLAAEFAKLGLRVDLVDGRPFQPFKMATSTEMGPKEKNRLALIAPLSNNAAAQKTDLELAKDFTPLALGGSGTFDLPLVFVGYGITDKSTPEKSAGATGSAAGATGSASAPATGATGPASDYDDYAGLDVKGKAVLILRHTPQWNQPHGRFAQAGRGQSRHATFDAKVSNAYQHGAAAVIFINDHAEIREQIANQQSRWQSAVDALVAEQTKFKQKKDPSPEETKKHRARIDELADRIKSASRDIKPDLDPLIEFARPGSQSSGDRPMPVLFCTRRSVAPMIKAVLGRDLVEIEKSIDQGPTPHSRELAGCKIQGETSVNRKEAEVKNVIAVLEGEGPNKDETIIIGAHYDHVGRGGAGSLARGSTEIHNGADDNASGSVTLVEVARQLVQRGQKLPRRVVFMAFTAEERGLLGSAHYVRSPIFPLEKTVAMLNMDMVGRLRDEKLIIEGADTATEFRPWIDALNLRHQFKITHQSGGYGPSDHASFYPKNIPVMHFYTGSHSDYHRPGDDVDKLNVPGMRRIGELVAETATLVAQAPSRPEYKSVAAPKSRRRGGDRPYFGSIPDFAQAGKGYVLSGVTKDGPAEKAGLKAGDAIVALGENKIANLDDFDLALRKFKSGDKVPVTIRRGQETLTQEVQLDRPR